MYEQSSDQCQYLSNCVPTYPSLNPTSQLKKLRVRGGVGMQLHRSNLTSKCLKITQFFDKSFNIFSDILIMSSGTLSPRTHMWIPECLP